MVAYAVTIIFTNECNCNEVHVNRLELRGTHTLTGTGTVRCEYCISTVLDSMPMRICGGDASSNFNADTILIRQNSKQKSDNPCHRAHQSIFNGMQSIANKIISYDCVGDRGVQSTNVIHISVNLGFGIGACTNSYNYTLMIDGFMVILILVPESI